MAASAPVCDPSATRKAKPGPPPPVRPSFTITATFTATPTPTAPTTSAGAVLLLLAVAVLAVVAAPPARVSASLALTATVAPCVGADLDPGETPGCARKLVLELTLTRQQAAGVSPDAVATVAQATDKTLFTDATAPTTSTTADSNSFPLGIVPPVTSGDAPADFALVSFPELSVRASAPRVQQRYTLQYVREFASSLWEKEVWDGSLYSCDKAANACGPYTRVDGTYSNHSNGLCCGCSVCVVGECGGVRLEDVCKGGVFGSICLMFSERKYGGFSLGSLAVYYALDVTVSGALLLAPDAPATNDNGDIAKNTVSFRVSPDSPEATEVAPLGLPTRLAVTVPASVSGTGAGSDFTRHILLTPSGLSSDPRVAAGKAEWLLLAPALVSLDGTGCDKIGISQEAWDNQDDDQCALKAGVCLHNQIEDLRSSDNDGEAMGQGGRYHARFLGDFTRKSVALVAGGTPVDSLLNNVAEISSITLAWTLPADAIAFVTVPSAGAIASVTAADTYAGLTASTVSVTAQNTGEEAGSRYTLRLINCTPGVTVVVTETNPGGYSRALAIGRGKSVTATFAVHQPAVDILRTMACTASLRNAAGHIIATRQATWTAGVPVPHDNSTVPDSDDDGGGGSDAGSSSSHHEGSGSNGGHVIPGNETDGQRQKRICAACKFRDIPCVFAHACTWKADLWAIIVIAALLLVALILSVRETCLRAKRDKAELVNYRHSLVLWREAERVAAGERATAEAAETARRTQLSQLVQRQQQLRTILQVHRQQQQASQLQAQQQQQQQAQIQAQAQKKEQQLQIRAQRRQQQQQLCFSRSEQQQQQQQSQSRQLSPRSGAASFRQSNSMSSRIQVLNPPALQPQQQQQPAPRRHNAREPGRRRQSVDPALYQSMSASGSSSSNNGGEAAAACSYEDAVPFGMSRSSGDFTLHSSF